MVGVSIVVVAVYAVQMVLLRLGLGRAARVERIWNYEPTVTIIVAARNEESHIACCLDSLLVVDYPANKMEIIVIDDRSTDHTAEILADFSRRSSLITILTTDQSDGALRGKTGAITIALDRAKGDIVMFTDADCTVPATWVRETLSYFDEKTGVVGGFTILDADNTFEGIQSLDWIFLFGLSAAAAGWNKPLTVIGNNLSIRRRTYEETGGYRAIPFSVTEDYALVQAILTRTRSRVRFSINQNTAVESQACPTWSQLFRQKQRWGVGGLDMVFRGMAIMTIGWLAKAAIIINLIMGNYQVTALLAVVTGLAEALFLWMPLAALGIRGRLKYFFHFEMYFTLYVLLLPFIALLSRNIVWKDRTLTP